MQLVGPLGLTLPLAGFNGGAIVAPDLSPLETRPLGRTLAAEAVALFRSKGLDVWVYTADLWIVPDPKGAHVERERFILGFDATVQESPRPEDVALAVKIVGVGDDADAMAAAEAEAGRLFAGRASASRSEPHFIDVTHLEANKGFVVTWLSRRLAIAPAAIATIGDMANDVRMFERSGVSVAMGNAGPDVRAKASAVTDDNEHDGFAKAVEALLAGRLPTAKDAA